MEYLTIHEILDYINDTCGYIGLSNTNKTTDERDDVISRQAINNWKSEYNRSVKAGKINASEIKSHIVDQYTAKYKKDDIERLIKHFEQRLIKPYNDKTIEVVINNQRKRISERLYYASAIDLFKENELDNTLEQFKKIFNQT